jgi:hypothetical protein
MVEMQIGGARSALAAGREARNTGDDGRIVEPGDQMQPAPAARIDRHVQFECTTGRFFGTSRSARSRAARGLTAIWF